MSARSDAPRRPAQRRDLSAKLMAAGAVATGTVLVADHLRTTLWPLVEVLVGASVVRLGDSGTVEVVLGAMIAGLGLFVLWACRKARSSDFAGTAIAMVVLFWPVVVFGMSAAYDPLCRWWLRQHGYERCDPAQVGYTYPPGALEPVTTYAHPLQGGCAALLPD